jgi:hypothetical protein
MNEHSIIVVNDIQKRIYTLRGVQVMLDKELADLYGVETRVLNQAVKRNGERFPDEFMFQLTEEDISSLKSQMTLLTEEHLRSQNVIPTKKHLANVKMLENLKKVQLV